MKGFIEELVSEGELCTLEKRKPIPTAELIKEEPVSQTNWTHESHYGLILT